MEDMLAIVIIWMLSLACAILSLAESKGKDWYNPIRVKKTLTMYIVNVGILIMALIFCSLLVENNLGKIVMSVLVLTVVAFFFKWERSNNGNSTEINDSKNKSGSNSLKKIKKLFSDFIESKESELENEIALAKMLTVFNAVFCLANIAYIGYIALTNKDNADDFEKIVLYGEDVLVVDITILLVLSFVTAIWIGNNIIQQERNTTDKSSENMEKEARKCSKKITNRNKG